MTYIGLMNEFWRQFRFKAFSDSEIKLYFFLLDECNIRQWLNPYELQTQYLEAVLQIKRKAIGEARNRLKQRGLIDFIAKPNRPTVYLIKNVDLGNQLLSQLFLQGNNKDTIEKQSGVQLEPDAETCIIDIKTLDKDLKEKPPKGGKKKTLSPAEMIEDFRRNSDNDCYLRFLDWLQEAAPYVAHNISPLSQKEFEKLKAEFGSNAIMLNIQNIENRKDLRRKYSSLYRTLINWCKNGYND